MKIGQDKLKEIALQHKEHFTSLRIWDRFAKENSLPSSKTYRDNFGNWDIAKGKILGEFEDTTPGYSQNELLSIARDHINEFTSKSHWEKYSKDNQLPSAQTYQKHFGSWNAVKKELNVADISSNTEKTELTDEELLNIARDHKKYFTTRHGWNSYAKDNNLPKSNVYVYRFGGTWKSVKEKLGWAPISKHLPHYSTKLLVCLAQENASFFTTLESWNNMAKKKGLPCSATYTNRFGSWNKARKAILEIEPEKEPAKYNIELLTSIALQHSNDFFKSKHHWANYAKENSLPSTNTFKKHFGSWSNATQQIGNQTE